jgi:nucleoside-diphosphate-sugar epimerase
MNLVIGKKSQLAQYFPSDHVKISSRNITKEIFDQKWNRVYICFAEQRTYNTKDDLFNEINYTYTKNIIHKLKAEKIIYYSTAELWNNTVGEINLNTPISYHKSDYVLSKEKITNYIKNNCSNTIIAYPFNFNSIYRMPPFLFGKIIDCIINKKQIEIGDTYYYRELLHPSFIVNESLKLETDKIIGTGKLIFINNFIKKIYNAFDMSYSNFVKEDITNYSIYRKNIFYAKQQDDFTEDDLLNIMVKEINDKFTNKIS